MRAHRRHPLRHRDSPVMGGFEQINARPQAVQNLPIRPPLLVPQHEEDLVAQNLLPVHVVHRFQKRVQIAQRVAVHSVPDKHRGQYEAQRHHIALPELSRIAQPMARSSASGGCVSPRMCDRPLICWCSGS